MKEYKKQIKIKLTAFCLFAAFLIIYSAVWALSPCGPFWMPGAADEHTRDFIMGMQLGLIVSLSAACGWRIFKFVKALRSEDNLKLLYIKENDERQKAVWHKTASAAVMIIYGSLGAAALIASYYNQTAFYTLIGVMVFISVTLNAILLYYNKKM